jgi:hypothetical protein
MLKTRNLRNASCLYRNYIISSIHTEQGERFRRWCRQLCQRTIQGQKMVGRYAI